MLFGLGRHLRKPWLGGCCIPSLPEFPCIHHPKQCICRRGKGTCQSSHLLRSCRNKSRGYRPRMAFHEPGHVSRIVHLILRVECLGICGTSLPTIDHCSEGYRGVRCTAVGWTEVFGESDMLWKSIVIQDRQIPQVWPNHDMAMSKSLCIQGS